MIGQCRAVLVGVELASTASNEFVSDGFFNEQRDMLGCDAEGSV